MWSVFAEPPTSVTITIKCFKPDVIRRLCRKFKILSLNLVNMKFVKYSLRVFKKVIPKW